MPSSLMLATVAVGVANILLAMVLLIVYRGVYARTRAPFTLALVLFAGAFLVHNLLIVYSFSTMMSLVPSALDPYLLSIGLLEAVGLGAMLWSATR